MDAEIAADKLARALAEYRGVVWSELSPADRDKWRDQCRDLLAYVESTAFFGFLPVPVEPQQKEGKS